MRTATHFSKTRRYPHSPIRTTRTVYPKRIRLFGEVSGQWFDVDLVRPNSKVSTARSFNPPIKINSLRDALIHVSNHGAIQWGVLEITVDKGRKPITRHWKVRGAGETFDSFAEVR
jgi:hypothetical protein